MTPDKIMWPWHCGYCVDFVVCYWQRGTHLTYTKYCTLLFSNMYSTNSHCPTASAIEYSVLYI